MKKLLTLGAILMSNLFYAQEEINLNHEKTEAENYFTTCIYQEIKGKMIVSAELNSQTYNFIFDTGAPTAVSSKIVEELKLVTNGKVDMTDQSSKKAPMKTVAIENLKLGGINFKNTPAVILEDMSLLGCLNVEGIIGSNILGNSIVQISGINKTITLTDQPKKLELKKKNGVELTVNPIQNTPYIKAYYLNGELSAHESILVDTGMEGFFDLSVHVYKNAVDKVDVFKVRNKAHGAYTAGIHGIAENSENYEIIIPELQIGKTYFKNLTTYTTTDYTSRIGTEVLKYGIMTLDFINKRFYFDAFDKKEAIDVKSKTWPLMLSMNNGKIVVGILWDEKLKDKIKVGDEVISFGKYNYRELDFCEKVLTKIEFLNEEEHLVLKDVNTGKIKEFKISKM